MAGHLSTAAHRCGGKLHHPQQQHSKQGLAGSLALPGVDTPLDLSQPAARLFGIELAGLQGSSQQAIDALKMQQQQQQDEQVGLLLYKQLWCCNCKLLAGNSCAKDAAAAARGVLGSTCTIP
jgi:hypothetical protein